eukprot:XP_019074406.1 PREDICTED: ubiquitin-like-specific protease 1A [Vitis vinifera]
MSTREDVVDTQSFNVLQSLVVDYVFNKALSKSELLVDFGHEHGVRGDFECLRPRQNLMDVVINLEASKLNYFERQFIGIRSIRCYLPTPFSQMILCGSLHPFFDRKTSIVSKYISELDDCEKLFIPMHDDCPNHWYLCVIDFKHFDIQILDSLRSKSRDEFRFKSVKIVVEFCQTFFKLYDIGKDVFQFSIDWAPSIPTQDNGWDCGVHVIRHMQRFKNGDSMTSSDFCNSVKICREITCDLVIHEGNREKQTIVAICELVEDLSQPSQTILDAESPSVGDQLSD